MTVIQIDDSAEQQKHLFRRKEDGKLIAYTLLDALCDSNCLNYIYLGIAANQGIYTPSCFEGEIENVLAARTNNNFTVIDIFDVYWDYCFDHEMAYDANALTGLKKFILDDESFWFEELGVASIEDAFSMLRDKVREFFDENSDIRQG